MARDTSPRLMLKTVGWLLSIGALLAGCASANREPVAVPAPSAAPVTTTAPIHPVMLGIDVLAERNFAPIAGKRVGLLTHPAGVNRNGVSTIDVLRSARNVQLVALFGPEHGIYGNEKADQPIPDRTDARTGLPVYSLYGRYRKPTPNMLSGLDAMVIDLQDIGVRSYTYVSCMRYTIEACFESGVEVIVLDRPNPLGGLKVDGPPLDREWMSYVGSFRVPYVHGLTIGELAHMSAEAPGVLQVSDEVRRRGRLTVVPMKGWHRSMRWPETGLRFVATSPYVQDFAAVVGYAMTGLGCQLGGFSHGIGPNYPFRGIAYRGMQPERLRRELSALNLPGLRFTLINATNREGNPTTGVYIEVADWNAWRPTELSFHLMRLACRFSGTNPFAAVSAGQADLFNKHVGSTTWWNALVRDGQNVDIDAFVAEWQSRARIYQEHSRRYWLY